MSMAVDAVAAFFEGDVFFGHDDGGIVATKLEMLDEDVQDLRRQQVGVLNYDRVRENEVYSFAVAQSWLNL